MSKTIVHKGPRVGLGAALLLLSGGLFAANCGVTDSDTRAPKGSPPSPGEPVHAAAGAALGDCVVIQRGAAGDVEDALINGDPAKVATNYGTSNSLTAGGGAGARHALVKWDLSAIPPNSIVTSATASLHVLLYGGAPVHAHRVVAPWAETTVTWSSSPEASPALEASVEFPDASEGQSTYADVTQMVQDWVRGVSPNQGILLERDDAPGLTVFASSEVADEETRPTLQVCYTAPPSVVPGAAEEQIFTLPGVEVRVLPGTQVTVGGAPVTGAFDMPIQKSADPSQAPSGPLATDPEVLGTVMHATDTPMLPVYHFGPSGAKFNPPLQVTVDVPSTMTEPNAWLCDDTGSNCVRRAAMFYDDVSVTPPKSRLYIELDHFSNLVLTNRAPVGMNYQASSPVMTGGVNIYYIWYGNWAGNTGPAIMTDLANGIGGSPYMLINTAYTDTTGAPSGAVSFGGSANVSSGTFGSSITDAEVRQIVSNVITAGTLPKDPSGVYFVLGASDVSVSGFCADYCGYHRYLTVAGADIKYSFVGNPATLCPDSCMVRSISPNGNPGVDAMANVVVHELVEAISNPLLNAWFDSNFNENADKCAWTFGATYTALNGALANVRFGARDFMIQQNWDPAKGVCAMGAQRFQGCTTNTPNGTPCDDGNACTQTDTCQGGVCVGSNPKVCAASDQCHAAGTCNTTTGACSSPAKANGAACNDGNACTQTDTCQSGVCVGGSPKLCAAADQCHVAGACNWATGACSSPAKANGTACNDGNAATGGDACLNGTCTGTAGPACPASPSQNLALGKPTSQSSDYSHPCNPVASKAVDGNTSGDFSVCSATGTNLEQSPWWQVDLGAVNVIDHVDLWTRTDCCGNRLSNFDVKLSTDGNWASPGVVSYHVPGQAPTQMSLPAGVPARYARVQLRGAEILTLAEVQVFGWPLGNLAVGKTATQSSNYSHPCNPVASKALDGNTSGDFAACSLSTTNADAKAWWQVDLGAVGFVDHVDLWNRTDCCGNRLSNFDVKLSTDGNWASPSVFSIYTPGQAPAQLSVPAGVAARYVRVQLRGTDLLTLAEVKVVGCQ